MNTASADPSTRRLYEPLAAIGRALAEPHRLQLLDELAQGERDVAELAEAAAMSTPNAWAHLQVLRRAGLVSAERHGRTVVYRPVRPAVDRLLGILREVAGARLAAEERVLRRPPDRVSSAELAGRLGDVLIVDVRPAVEYRHGRIAGALSLPLDSLPDLLATLPPNREVVAYGRGPYCTLADDAVRFLRDHGFRASRLDAGFPDWRAEGRPVEVDTPDRGGRLAGPRGAR